jgi:hypothetical protein
VSSSTGASTWDTETPVKLLDAEKEGVMPEDIPQESMDDPRNRNVVS